MTSELFSVFASNVSGAVTGVFPTVTANTSSQMFLVSNLWSPSQYSAISGYDQFIRIPKGCAFKIWESKVQSNTAPATVHTQVVNISGTGVYQTIATDTVDTSGAEQRTARSGRPLVIESHEGETFVRFVSYTPVATAGSGTVYCTYNVEIVELNTD